MTEERSTKLLRLNSFAALHFHQNLLSLPSDHPAKLWLESRGIGPEAIDVFKIGFAIDDWWALPKALKQEGFIFPDGQAVGLLQARKVPDSRGHYYSIFRDRVMFPIQNPNGSILGFIGRDVATDAAAKYLGPTRSVTLPYCSQFFGIYQAQDAITASTQVFVVEGVTSAIALYMAGIRNVVSILGLGFHHDQAMVLKNLGAEVTGIFDGDEPGWHGLYRFLHMMKNREIPAKGVWNRRLSKPREYLKAAGLERTKAHLAKARSFEDLFNSKRPRTFITNP